MIFIDNKYTKWYFALIAKSQLRERSLGYTEKHHIIPKSLGGTNDKDNLVNLTAREHFICHLLLTKMCKDNANRKMTYAFKMMLSSNGNHSRYIPQSQRYENLRISLNQNLKGRTFSDDTKKLMSLSKKGKPKSEHIANSLRTMRKGKTNSDEHKLKCSQALTGREFTDEWRDRLSKAHLTRISICPHCGKEGHSLNMNRWHIPRCLPSV